MYLNLINKEWVRSQVPQKKAKSSAPEGMNFNVQRTELWPCVWIKMGFWEYDSINVAKEMGSSHIIEGLSGKDFTFYLMQ